MANLKIFEYTFYISMDLCLQTHKTFFVSYKVRPLEFCLEIITKICTLTRKNG